VALSGLPFRRAEPWSAVGITALGGDFDTSQDADYLEKGTEFTHFLFLGGLLRNQPATQSGDVHRTPKCFFENSIFSKCPAPGCR